MNKISFFTLYSIKNGKIVYDNKTYTIKKDYTSRIKLLCWFHTLVPILGIGIGSLITSDKNMRTIYRLAGLITGYLIAYLRKRLLLPEYLEEIIE